VVDLDPATVETNIVVFHLRNGAPDAAQVVEEARRRGVLVLAFARRTVRAATHLDVDAVSCRRAGEILRAIVDGR
jgi:threonine aldolase